MTTSQPKPSDHTSAERPSAERSMQQPPHFVLSVDGSIYGEDTEENREWVRRIHACVNACEGISTEELENGVIGEMQQVLQQVAPILRAGRKSDGEPAAGQEAAG